MKSTLSTLAVITSFLMITVTGGWAHGGGMGGGMGSGMMGQGGQHMMDSIFNGQMGSGRWFSNGNREDGQSGSSRRIEGEYGQDLRHLDNLRSEIHENEQALSDEAQKETPDKTRMKKLGRTLDELTRQYDDAQSAFNDKWHGGY